MKKNMLVLLAALTVSIIAGCRNDTTRYPTRDETTITIDHSRYETESEIGSNADADSASQQESGLSTEMSGGTPLAP